MNRNKIIACVSVILALATLLPLACTKMFGLSYGEVSSVLSDGSIYKIKNKKTGTYLFCYDYKNKQADKLILDALEESNSEQFFRVIEKGNNEWQIVPRSENEKYALSYPADTSSGAFISKAQKTSAQALSFFEITFLPGGECTISPSNGNNNKAVLTASSSVNSKKKQMVIFSDYVYGEASQLWILEKVETEKLTTAFSKTRVKLFSTGTMFARKFPDNADTTDIIWSSSDDSIILMGADGKYCAVSTGSAVLTAYSGGCSVSVTVEVVDSDCFTWYSQMNVTGSDWSAENLKGLKFRAEGMSLKFAVDNNESSTQCWMDRGCAICSCAMVLHNLGATLDEGFDLRSGQTDNLPADPYTVSLANAGVYGPDSVNTTVSGDPIYTKWSYITGSFTADGEDITYKKYYVPSKKLIKSLIEQHPAGVILGLQKGSNTHYMVAAGVVNPEETKSSKIQFIVYDPAASTAEAGDGVPFSQCASSSRYSYIYGVFVIDTVSSFN